MTLCPSVGVFNGDCSISQEAFTADLMRAAIVQAGQAPAWFYLLTFPPNPDGSLGCVRVPEDPPAGWAFLYDVVIHGSVGEPVPTCGAP